MDADTVMVDDFLERAVAEFEALPDLGAVGGVFFGDDARGLLAQMQRNEYLRYGRDISRRQGRVYVLTGTASLFRADALAAVADARGSVLPGRQRGDVYDTYSLTEDNELTLALKTLGARMVSPRGCRVRTELMPTWRARGINGNAGSAAAREHRHVRIVFGDCAKPESTIALGYGVLALVAYLTLTVLSYFAFGVFVVFLFWCSSARSSPWSALRPCGAAGEHVCWPHHC